MSRAAWTVSLCTFLAVIVGGPDVAHVGERDTALGVARITRQLRFAGERGKAQQAYNKTRVIAVLVAVFIAILIVFSMYMSTS